MKKVEEILYFVFVVLAALLCAFIYYLFETPATVTGNVVLVQSTSRNVALVFILVLASLSIVLGTIITVRNIRNAKTTPALVAPSISLHDYINNAREAGFTDEHIASKLKEKNWDDSQIKNHLN